MTTAYPPSSEKLGIHIPLPTSEGQKRQAKLK